MPDYEILRVILDEAYDQATIGKGRKRHARNLDFQDQPIMAIGKMVGPGFNAGQAMKKIQEAIGLVAAGDPEKAQQELLGAIVYCASTIALLESHIGPKEMPKETTANNDRVVQEQRIPNVTKGPLFAAMKAVDDKGGA